MLLESKEKLSRNVYPIIIILKNDTYNYFFIIMMVRLFNLTIRHPIKLNLNVQKTSTKTIPSCCLLYNDVKIARCFDTTSFLNNKFGNDMDK